MANINVDIKFNILTFSLPPQISFFSPTIAVSSLKQITVDSVIVCWKYQFYYYGSLQESWIQVFLITGFVIKIHLQGFFYCRTFVKWWKKTQSLDDKLSCSNVNKYLIIQHIHRYQSLNWLSLIIDGPLNYIGHNNYFECVSFHIMFHIMLHLY